MSHLGSPMGGAKRRLGSPMGAAKRHLGSAHGGREASSQLNPWGARSVFSVLCTIFKSHREAGVATDRSPFGVLTSCFVSIVNFEIHV